MFSLSDIPYKSILRHDGKITTKLWLAMEPFQIILMFFFINKEFCQPYITLALQTLLLATLLYIALQITILPEWFDLKKINNL